MQKNKKVGQTIRLTVLLQSGPVRSSAVRGGETFIYLHFIISEDLGPARTLSVLIIPVGLREMKKRLPGY